VRKWGPNTRTTDYAQQLFRTVCSLSDAETTSYSLLGFLGQLVRSPLAASSTETYFQAAKKLIRQDNYSYRMTKAVMRAHADSDVDGGADVEDSVLLEVLKFIPVARRPAYVIMLLIGCRTVLLRWLRIAQIAPRRSAEDNEIIIHVQVRVDKNAWKRLHRAGLSIPREWLSYKLDQHFFDWHKGYTPNDRPFEKLSATSLNYHLKHAVNAANHARSADGKEELIPHLTTKAFRRAFFARVFRAFDGQWEKVQEFTLHHSKYVTKAHYLRWKGSEMPPMDGVESDSEFDEEEEEEDE